MPLFLSQSFRQTNLDLEDPRPSFFFNTLDTITVYPATNTGTPTNTTNPGASTNYFQTFLPPTQLNPNATYLENIRNDGSRFFRLGNIEDQYDIFDATNLDVSKSAVDGGVPYDQIKDPTIYPTTTTNRTPIRGRFATAGAPPTKFNQTFNPTPTWGKTYLEFIRPYI
jgi:hypothetical protein